MHKGIKQLDATTLKLIALVAMTVDHIGLIFYPDAVWLRWIGRIAYPIFAYMIAEGCQYTKHRKKYFLSIFGIGLLCSVSSYIAEKSLYQSIFTTFSFSLMIIFSIDGFLKAYKKGSSWGCVLYGATTAAVVGGTFALCNGYLISGLEVDYGFWGIITPVLVWLARGKKNKLIALLVGLFLVAAANANDMQILSVAALPLLLLYNGERGRGLGKLFYIYYPAHLAVLYGLSYIITAQH